MDTKDTDREVADLSALIGADAEKGARGVYEVGYHLLPTLSEDEVAVAVEGFMKALKDTEAEIIGERSGVRIPLAYAIEKKIEGTKYAFDSAYFGWVAFETDSTTLSVIDQGFKTHQFVLRHLLVKTTKDAVAATLADAELDVGAAKEEVVDTVEEATEGAVESVGADTEAGA